MPKRQQIRKHHPCYNGNIERYPVNHIRTFRYAFFVTALKWQYSILAGAATVAIMVLPTIMRTTEEALLAVPDSFREASLALGAGKIRTIFK